MEGCTASDKYDPAASPDGGEVLAETTEGDGLVGSIETTTHSVDDRLGLLENLLLHEVVEAALHDLLKLDLECLDGTDVGGSVILVEAVNVQRALVDVGNVVVLEVQDLLCVLDDRGWVRGEEELGGHRHAVVGEESTRLRAVEKRLVGRSEKSVALLQGNVVGSTLSGESGTLVVLDIDEVDLHLLLGPDTNDKGRTLAGSDNLMGEVDRLEEQAESALELLDDGLDQAGEAQVRVLGVDVLCELGNSLCVGLRLKLEALALEQDLELLVVCDDSIVDDGELPVGVGPVGGGLAVWAVGGGGWRCGDIPVGMAVDTRWRAVGGPAGVCNTGVRVEDLVQVEALLLDQLLQRSDLADLLDGVDLVPLVAVDGQAGRVVAAVL